MCASPLKLVFEELSDKQDERASLALIAAELKKPARATEHLPEDAPPTPREIARDHKQVIDATIREMGESPTTSQIGLQAQKLRMQLEPLMASDTFERALLNVLKLRGFTRDVDVRVFKHHLRNNIKNSRQDFENFALNLIRELDDIIKSKAVPINPKGLHAASSSDAREVYLEFWREEVRNHLGELKSSLLAYLTEEGAKDPFLLAENKIAQEQRGRHPNEFDPYYAQRRGQRHYLSAPSMPTRTTWFSAKQLAAEEKDAKLINEAIRFVKDMPTPYLHGAINEGYLKNAVLQMNTYQLEAVLDQELPQSVVPFVKKRLEYLKSFR